MHLCAHHSEAWDSLLGTVWWAPLCASDKRQSPWNCLPSTVDSQPLPRVLTPSLSSFLTLHTDPPQTRAYLRVFALLKDSVNTLECSEPGTGLKSLYMSCPAKKYDLGQETVCSSPGISPSFFWRSRTVYYDANNWCYSLIREGGVWMETKRL